MEDKKPVHTISHGTVRACIWRNNSATKLLHDVTFYRSHRQGDGWGTSYNFGGKELLTLARVILDAHVWILTQLSGQMDATSPPAAIARESPSAPNSG